MIFSELYSAYYNAVAGILTKALTSELSEKALRAQVLESAFSESVLTILPALKSGRWPLLDGNLSPAVKHPPTMPLTLLEKRWLKALLDDPRIRLFDAPFPELVGVPPLFTAQDYRIYDRYGDGDPFGDEDYIRNFKTVCAAVKEDRPVTVTAEDRHGRQISASFFPKGFEYSMKEDRIRVLAAGCKCRQFDMARIRTCEAYTGPALPEEAPEAERGKELVLTVTDERKALERAMLHFAHFEKRAERIDGKRYLLRLKYYESDEKELVLRIFSFGPFVRAEAPRDFVDLIKQRLILQKSCELK